jgi:hypothetical protein
MIVDAGLKNLDVQFSALSLVLFHVVEILAGFQNAAVVGVVLASFFLREQVEDGLSEEFLERTAHVLQVGGVAVGDPAFEVDSIDTNRQMLDKGVIEFALLGPMHESGVAHEPVPPLCLADLAAR